MPFANPLSIQDDLLAIGPRDDDKATFSEVIASRFSIVSQRLANAEAAIASVTASTLSEIEGIFASLSLESCRPLSPPVAVSPSRWLLNNLHNPYPPAAVRRAMEESSELGGRPVNEWFARARQRIGWTRLLRDRFNGRRSATIDAAFRAFVRDHTYSPLDVELSSAFMAVKAHANLVYASTSPVIQDITSHPSPPSRSPSATPTLANSTDSGSGDHDDSQLSRKRKRSCSDLLPESHPISPLPRKRRLTASPKMTSFNSHSPSLPTTCANDDSSPSLPRPLKRRLSEFGSDEPAVKKSRGSDWAPRKQTVSDPLPLHTQSFDWESWCTEAFALPPSVTTSHPVPDALDFELFNFEVFPTSQSTDITVSFTDARPEFPEKPDAWLDSLLAPSSQTEKDPRLVSWESFFNFELPSDSSPMPSLTNSPSPSSPDTQWSLSPPELPCFESFEPPLFEFSPSPLFKIPTLYPIDGVEIVDDDTPLIY